MEHARWKVLQDYATPRLNGSGPVVWTEGDNVDLTEDDAAWVNRDREGTLADSAAVQVDEDQRTDMEREADEQAAAARAALAAAGEPAPATTPAAEQAGGRPTRGQRRRKDSAG